MSNILDKIIAYKHQEVAQAKQKQPISLLEKSPLFERTCVSLKKRLQADGRIIAEIKHKSPSKGVIHPNMDVEQIATGYEQAGVAGISVLTDQHFFGGSTNNLQIARQTVACPILRKDFMVDEYQVVAAKAMGSDVILLIAAALEPSVLTKLAKLAKSLGLEVLMEVHNAAELHANLQTHLDIVGVNNRDLKRFAVDIQTSLHLVDQIPNDFAKISESGISKPQTVVQLQKSGYQGFLIGEHFMRQAQPALACAHFMEEIRLLTKK